MPEGDAWHSEHHRVHCVGGVLGIMQLHRRATAIQGGATHASCAHLHRSWTLLGCFLRQDHGLRDPAVSCLLCCCCRHLCQRQVISCLLPCCCCLGLKTPAAEPSAAGSSPSRGRCDMSWLHLAGSSCLVNPPAAMHRPVVDICAQNIADEPACIGSSLSRDDQRRSWVRPSNLP